MNEWHIHYKTETISTNLDARGGRPGDVYVADFQTAGRGRLDHKWLSPPKTNLMMSVVLSVGGLAPEQVATLPLVVGLDVLKGLEKLSKSLPLALKWPNDILIGGRKVAGILCERVGDNVIAGIGVNVCQRDFAPEIAARATSLVLATNRAWTTERVRDAVLGTLALDCARWREGGFAAVYPELQRVDYLKGRLLAVRQTDGDEEPVCGISGGIREDGSLDVDGISVYAGEAHVERSDAILTNH